MDSILAEREVVDTFLTDLQLGAIPIAAALSWIEELKREGLHAVAAEIETRWPRAITTLQEPAA